MSTLQIFLFGKMQICFENREFVGIDQGKVKELFCYLLTHRNRQHPREVLANLLWGDHSTAHSKKYLRQVLWQLHTALETLQIPAASMLNINANWVSLESTPYLELDIATFEDVFLSMQQNRKRELEPELVLKIQTALSLYRGDLLDGWYSDWCLFERERLQGMYLAMLNQMIRHCESHRLYEAGLAYGTLVLGYDSASERTHRDLMRLHFMAGDRTAALRQYERCVSALAKELEIKPSQATIELYNQIRGEQFPDSQTTAPYEAQSEGSMTANIVRLFNRLKKAQSVLVELQAQMERDIAEIELEFWEQTSSP